MHMRIDPARHDIASGGVQNLVTTQPFADLGDHAIFDQNIRLIGQIRRHDRAIFNNCCHNLTLPGA